MAKKLEPHIWHLNGQTVFPAYGQNTGLRASYIVYVVLNGIRKEVEFTWQELETHEKAASANG